MPPRGQSPPLVPSLTPLESLHKVFYTPILEKFIFNIDIKSGNGRKINHWKTNPFHYFSEVRELFTDSKIHISSELRKIKGRINKELYLDELLTRINQIVTFSSSDIPDADDYLKPYNLTFEQLMESTDKSIPIVYEIGLSEEHINYHYQDPIINTEKFSQKATFVRLVPYHYKSKMIEFIIGLKEKIMQDNNVKKEIVSDAPATPKTKDNENIKLDAFNKFMEYFEFPYPYDYNIVEHYHHWKENLNYLKNEIESNLPSLDTPKSNLYLSSLTRRLAEKRKNVNTTKDQLDKWYDMYNTNEEDALYSNNSSNMLHKSINRYPLNIKEALDDGIDPNTDMIQRTFHNYHYGQFIDAALSFISDIKKALEPIASNNIQQNITNIDILNRHTQTNLTQNNIIENNQINILSDKNDDKGPQNIKDDVREANENKVKDPHYGQLDKKPISIGFVLLKKTIISDQFKNFYYTLFDNGFIEESLPPFRNAFKGDQSFKKVIWKKDQNELNYLICNLIKRGVIKKYGAWIHTHNMFELENRTPLGKHLSTNFYNKANHDILDLAINLLT